MSLLADEMLLYKEDSKDSVSLCKILLLLYRNSIDSYILILYLRILLNSCISSNTFLSIRI